MRRSHLAHLRLAPIAFIAAAVLAAPAAAQTGVYFPEAGDRWERRSPEQVGMDAALLAAAVEFARENESGASRDLEQNHYSSFGREPFGEAVGPFKERGPATGMIVRNGYIVAEWGEPERVDMTFSVTKSFLSTVVGVAYDRGLIPDLHEPVRAYAPVYVPASLEAERGMDGVADAVPLFDTEHNRTITWDHLLRQTSDWEGTLWGKPDWADRPQGQSSTWLTRECNEPGTSYKYNDVRVNLLALAALQLWREPLPRVLRREVMDPIGASNTWQWHGYENSWVVVDGYRVQSVSGGGHWGGGMFISARDQARFGYLTLRDGRWGDRRILSEEWLEMARTPTEAEPGYGFMNFFLNGDRDRYPSAPETAFAHLGAGNNVIYVDQEHDLVIVARWITGRAVDGLIQRVIASIDATQTDGS